MNQRLAYSALLTEADGLTQEGVSSLTGLDSKGTVAASLKALAGHGLAIQGGRHWFALEPKEGREDWFVLGIKDEDWRRRFSYSKLYRRAENCPLTLRQVVVYSTLISLAKRSKDHPDLPPACRGRVCDGLTHEYLSLLTGVGVKTVKATIVKMADLKLARSFLSTLRSRFALVLLEPKDEAISWFLKKEVETYPGLFEFVGNEALPVEESVVHLEHADEVGPGSAPELQSPESAQTSEWHAGDVVPGRHRPSDQPIKPGDPEVLRQVFVSQIDTTDPLEKRRRRAEGLRLEQEREIEMILLGFSYSKEAVATLSRSFDKRGLPSFDAYKKMIQNAEDTFRRNKSEGLFARVQTSELLLVKWLDHHRKEAVERHENAIDAMNVKAWNQRLGLIGRIALGRHWEDYADSMTAPFDARLIAERVDGGEVRWDGWERDYGQEACRKSLLGLPRVRIDEMLVEAGRIEPEDFEARLREIVPPKPVFRKPTEEERYEAWQAEMRSA